MYSKQSTCLTGFLIALFFFFPFSFGHNFKIGIRKWNFLGLSFHRFFAENAILYHMENHVLKKYSSNLLSIFSFG